MTCSWLVQVLFITCLWLVHYLFMDRFWLVHDLFMTCSWLVSKNFITCSGFAHYFFYNFFHNLFTTCLCLVRTCLNFSTSCSWPVQALFIWEVLVQNLFTIVHNLFKTSSWLVHDLNQTSHDLFKNCSLLYDLFMTFQDLLIACLWQIHD